LAIILYGLSYLSDMFQATQGFRSESFFLPSDVQ
jgi:hypothetical protein